MFYFLRVTLTDGFRFTLEGTFGSIEAAQAAASRFVRDYSKPCGVGVSYVAVCEGEEEA